MFNRCQCPSRAASLFYSYVHDDRRRNRNVSMPFPGSIPFLLWQAQVFGKRQNGCQCPSRAASLFYRDRGTDYARVSRVSMPFPGSIPFLQQGAEMPCCSRIQTPFFHLIVHTILFFLFSESSSHIFAFILGNCYKNVTVTSSLFFRYINCILFSMYLDPVQMIYQKSSVRKKLFILFNPASDFFRNHFFLFHGKLLSGGADKILDTLTPR